MFGSSSWKWAFRNWRCPSSAAAGPNPYMAANVTRRDHAAPHVKKPYAPTSPTGTAASVRISTAIAATSDMAAVRGSEKLSSFSSTSQRSVVTASVTAPTSIPRSVQNTSG